MRRLKKQYFIQCYPLLIWTEYLDFSCNNGWCFVQAVIGIQWICVTWRVISTQPLQENLAKKCETDLVWQNRAVPVPMWRTQFMAHCLCQPDEGGGRRVGRGVEAKMCPDSLVFVQHCLNLILYTTIKNLVGKVFTQTAIFVPTNNLNKIYYLTYTNWPWFISTPSPMQSPNHHDFSPTLQERVAA